MDNQHPIPYTVIGHTRSGFQNSPGTIFLVVRSKEELTNLCANRSLPAEPIAQKIDFSRQNLIVLSRITGHMSNFLGIKSVDKINGITNIEFGEIDRDNGTPRIAMPRPGYSSVFFSIKQEILSSRFKLNDMGKMKIEQLDSLANDICAKKSKFYKGMDEYFAELFDVLELEEFDQLEKTGDPSLLSLTDPKRAAKITDLYLKWKQAESKHSQAIKQLEQRHLQVLSRVSGRPLIPVNEL